MYICEMQVCTNGQEYPLRRSGFEAIGIYYNPFTTPLLKLENEKPLPVPKHKQRKPLWLQQSLLIKTDHSRDTVRYVLQVFRTYPANIFYVKNSSNLIGKVEVKTTLTLHPSHPRRSLSCPASPGSPSRSAAIRQDVAPLEISTDH
jgi:hypothetical protein